MTHRVAGGRQRLAEWIGRRGGLLITAIGGVLLATYVAAILAFPKPDGRIIFGDATHEFVQLRSIVFDRDLNFQNEYVRIYGLHGVEPGTEWIFTELTPTGHVRNYMPVGPALLWMPLYLVVAAVEFLLAWLGLGPRPDGFGRPFQLVPGITGVIAATGATYLSWRLARRFTDDASATIGTLAAWLGSHALYYTLVSPSYSHAASMLTAALFFVVWIGTRDAPSLRRFFAWGALAGLSALMRWQDALFLWAPLIDAVRWRAPWRQRVAAALLAAAGAAAAFSPQMVVWTVLYGRPLAVPQGPSFLQWWRPHLVDVLVSSNHGLFSWAPILLLAMVGLVTFVRRSRALAPGLVVIVLASWYVNASVADWWAGEAFGARRFLSLYPLFVVGLAVWTGGGARPRIGRVLALGAFLVANALLLFQYELAMKGVHAAPFPSGWLDMYLARFVVPLRVIAWHR